MLIYRLAQIHHTVDKATALILTKQISVDFDRMSANFHFPSFQCTQSKIVDYFEYIFHEICNCRYKRIEMLLHKKVNPLCFFNDSCQTNWIPNIFSHPYTIRLPCIRNTEFLYFISHWAEHIYEIVVICQKTSFLMFYFLVFFCTKMKEKLPNSEFIVHMKIRNIPKLQI